MAEFGLINMNARLYDPVIGRFLSPDPYVPDPDFSLDYNRYMYARNNPLIYTDPDGEFILTALIIGAVVGAYTGGVIANNGKYNPVKWDYGSGKTWGYMLGGALIGGLSSGFGVSIAASGGFMSNTLGIMGGSFMNSVGMAAITGQGSPTISFGFGSFDLGNGQFSTIFDWGDLSTMEKIGYGFGALANLTDVVSLFGGGTNYDINSARTNKKQGDEWWGHYSGTGDGINISVGPGANDHTSKMDFFKTIDGVEWPNYANNSGTWSIRVNNANQKILQGMTRNIENGKGLFFGDLKWNLVGQSCVNHTARSLWAVGIPTLPINLHPHILNFQLFVRQFGIYSSPYLYNIK